LNKDLQTMPQKLLVRRAAVLGAGVMGAQIAAHLSNAGVDTVLFDLAAKEGDPNGIVLKAIDHLGKLSPAPLASKALAAAIVPANYDAGLELLEGCDLVIEAIAERMDWKQDLYRRIAPFVPAHAVLASNTSGLGINALSDVLPEELRHRFCGLHFFNPPRYMHLAELIPARTTDKAVLEGLETFLTTQLGKGVVHAKDTPNFIGNRIGVFSILATIHHTEQAGLGFDEVDALTGPLIGRPKSATYRTSDVVGLDTMAHVIKTMADTLPDDPWHAYFASPKWLDALIAKGALGQKTGAGIFRKAGKDILVLDLQKQDYRPADRAAAPEVVEILKLKDPAEKFARLRSSDHPQAKFLWALFRDLFHYCAYQLESIAETARDIDLAIRWGYGWALGPFETWQAAGWKQVAGWIAEDIVAGKAMSQAPLPDWVFDGRDGVHGAEGSYSPARNAKLPRSALPVYKRQRFQPLRRFEIGVPGIVGQGIGHGLDDVGHRVQADHVGGAVGGALGAAHGRAGQRVDGVEAELELLGVMHGGEHREHADAVADEVGRVLGDHHALADGGDQEGLEAVQHVLVGEPGRDQLDQVHVARRIEEVHAAEAVAHFLRQRLGQRVDRQARGIGGDDRGLRQVAGDLLVQVEFPVHALGNGLDDQVDILQVIEIIVVVGRDDRGGQGLVGQRGRRQLGQVGDRFQRDAALRTLFRGQVEQHGFHAGVGQVRGNLRAHDTGAQHGGLADAQAEGGGRCSSHWLLRWCEGWCDQWGRRRWQGEFTGGSARRRRSGSGAGRSAQDALVR
jgi:3-hydroxyacyl-CoA dehydrogenase